MIIATRDLDVPRSALAVGAHPDDIEFGAGATLARWARAGCDVTLVICTDGSKGTWDPTADSSALIATRRREQLDSAAALMGLEANSDSAQHVEFLDRTDGELVVDSGLISDLARLIRERRPEVLMGHDRWKAHRLHPDHRAAGIAVVDALVGARDPHFFKDHQLDSHRPTSLLLFETDQPNHAEAATRSDLDAKLAALESHRSQFESTMFVDPDDQGHQLARFRRATIDLAAQAGRVIGREAAELFRSIPTDR